jgi:hypothetical protein
MREEVGLRIDLLAGLAVGLLRVGVARVGVWVGARLVGVLPTVGLPRVGVLEGIRPATLPLVGLLLNIRLRIISYPLTLLLYYPLVYLPCML